MPGVPSFSARAFLESLAKVGRRRCPPLGVFNPPPTEGVQGVLNRMKDRLQPTSASHHKTPISKFLSRSGSWLSDPSLLFSPQEGGDDRNPAPSSSHSPPLDDFFSKFSPSKAFLKIYIEKTSKKVRKSRILASQNPPKTHPKCLQKRGSKKDRFFACIFGIRLLFCYTRNPENINFPLVKLIFFWFSLKTSCRNFRQIFS